MLLLLAIGVDGRRTAPVGAESLFSLQLLNGQFLQRVKTDARDHLCLDWLHGGIHCVSAVAGANNHSIRTLAGWSCNEFDQLFRHVVGIRRFSTAENFRQKLDKCTWQFGYISVFLSPTRVSGLLGRRVQASRICAWLNEYYIHAQ